MSIVMNQASGGVSAAIIFQNVIFGPPLPDEGVLGQLIIFRAAATGLDAYDTDGTTPMAAAAIGDSFFWFNSRWINTGFNFGDNDGNLVIHHDATLAGGNTQANPLRVATPFTSALLTKLNGIQAGAQVNPLHSVKFSALSGDVGSDIPDSVVGLYLNNSLVQSGSIDQVSHIYIADENSTFGENPADAATDLDAINTTRFFKDKLDNKGTFKLLFNKQGTTEQIWVQVDHIEATEGGWICSDLFWWNSTNLAGVNDSWNIIAGTDAVFSDDIIDFASKLSEYITLQEVQPKESDFISNFNNDILATDVTDKRYQMCFASTESGVPVAANLYGKLNEVEDGDRTLIIAATQWKNTDFDENKALTADDFAVNEKVYFNYNGVNGWHKTFTPSAAPVLVGAGNAQYYYVFGAVATSGTPAAQSDNTVSARDREPSTFWDKTEIPWTSIVGEPAFLKAVMDVITDDDVLSADKIVIIQGLLGKNISVGDFFAWHDEHHTGVRTIPGYEYDTAIPSNSDTSHVTTTNTGIAYIIPTNDDENESIKMKVRPGKIVRYYVSDTRYKQMRVTSTPFDFLGRLSFNVTDVVDIGTPVTDGLDVSVQIESNIVARGEFSKIAFDNFDWANLTLGTPSANDILIYYSGSDNTIKQFAAGVLGEGGDQESFNSGTWTTYSALTFNNNDLIQLCSSEAEHGLAPLACMRFGDISTSSTPINTGFSARRSGNNLQIRRTSGSATLYVRVFKTGFTST